MEKDSKIVYWSIAEAVPDRDGLNRMDFLSEGERRRLDGMRFDKRRREWLLGRQTVKSLLLRSLDDLRGVKPSDLSIENEPEGAPYVVYEGERLDISLSISHRDQLAFCAMMPGDGCSVGADIEKIEAREPVFIGDYFTETEQRIVHNGPKKLCDLKVTLIWSAKEAVLKALRKGLRLDTHSVEVQSIQHGSEDWGSFIAHSQYIKGDLWRGWWRTQGEYVLTLVVLSRTEKLGPGENIRLVQVPG